MHVNPTLSSDILEFFVHFILSSRSLQYKHGIMCMHTIFKYNNIGRYVCQSIPFSFSFFGHFKFVTFAYKMT